VFVVKIGISTYAKTEFFKIMSIIEAQLNLPLDLVNQ